MKYLKSFNENTENLKEELLDFCESNLAYLLDEAKLQVVPNPGGRSELHLIKIMLDESKHWDEIKDYMIPFLTRLVAKYEISQPFHKDPFTSTSGSDKKDTKSVEDKRLYILFSEKLHPSYIQIKDLIEDKDTPNARISYMFFYVKGYKAENKSFLTKIKSFFK